MTQLDCRPKNTNKWNFNGVEKLSNLVSTLAFSNWCVKPIDVGCFEGVEKDEAFIYCTFFFRDNFRAGNQLEPSRRQTLSFFLTFTDFSYSMSISPYRAFDLKEGTGVEKAVSESKLCKFWEILYMYMMRALQSLYLTISELLDMILITQVER